MSLRVLDADAPLLATAAAPPSTRPLIFEAIGDSLSFSLCLTAIETAALSSAIYFDRTPFLTSSNTSLVIVNTSCINGLFALRVFRPSVSYTPLIRVSLQVDSIPAASFFAFLSTFIGYYVISKIQP